MFVDLLDNAGLVRNFHYDMSGFRLARFREIGDHSCQEGRLGSVHKASWRHNQGKDRMSKPARLENSESNHHSTWRLTGRVSFIVCTQKISFVDIQKRSFRSRTADKIKRIRDHMIKITTCRAFWYFSGRLLQCHRLSLPQKTPSYKIPKLLLLGL